MAFKVNPDAVRHYSITIGKARYGVPAKTRAEAVAKAEAMDNDARARKIGHYRV